MRLLTMETVASEKPGSPCPIYLLTSFIHSAVHGQGVCLMYAIQLYVCFGYTKLYPTHFVTIFFQKYNFFMHMEIIVTICLKCEWAGWLVGWLVITSRNVTFCYLPDKGALYVSTLCLPSQVVVKEFQFYFQYFVPPGEKQIRIFLEWISTLLLKANPLPLACCNWEWSPDYLLQYIFARKWLPNLLFNCLARWIGRKQPQQFQCQQ